MISKYLLMALLVILLNGCGAEYEAPATSGNQKFDIVCIDGVEYFYNNDKVTYKGWLTAHLKRDGKPYLCDSGGN